MKSKGSLSKKREGFFVGNEQEFNKLTSKNQKERTNS